MPGTPWVRHKGCQVAAPPTSAVPVPASSWRTLVRSHTANQRCSVLCSVSNMDAGPASSGHGSSRRETLVGLGLSCLLAVTADLGWSALVPRSSQAAGTLRPLTPEEQAAVDKALKQVIPKSKAPVALRLVFHDAGTYSSAAGGGGANASIQYELERPENFGLKRGWRLIEQLSATLKNTPAAGLSNADLIALAGAQAVAVCNGPRIPVLVGRTDATGPDPEGRLLKETAPAAEQKASFADKGINARELVALLGAHTIGSKGYGDPFTFDNVYYKELLRKPWLNTSDPMASMIGIPSDHVLPDDAELLPYIKEYAEDQAAFHRDFSAAYLKMTQLGV